MGKTLPKRTQYTNTIPPNLIPQINRITPLVFPIIVSKSYKTITAVSRRTTHYLAGWLWGSLVSEVFRVRIGGPDGAEYQGRIRGCK